MAVHLVCTASGEAAVAGNGAVAVLAQGGSTTRVADLAIWAAVEILVAAAAANSSAVVHIAGDLASAVDSGTVEAAGKLCAPSSLPSAPALAFADAAISEVVARFAVAVT
jgi:hypothetical protein